MIRTMASPEQESELNGQFLVDSMPAMTTRLGPTATSITSTNFGSNAWASLCTTRPSGGVSSLTARLNGLWPSSEPASRPERNSDTKLASAGDREYRRNLHCKVPHRDGRGNNLRVKDLVDRFSANDRTHAGTMRSSASPKFDSLGRDR